jgi:hypothetical protein
MICILIASSPDLCDNLYSRKIHCCGPVTHITEQKCCKIFAKRNSNWNRVTFRWVRSDLIELWAELCLGYIILAHLVPWPSIHPVILSHSSLSTDNAVCKPIKEGIFIVLWLASGIIGPAKRGPSWTVFGLAWPKRWVWLLNSIWPWYFRFPCGIMLYSYLFVLTNFFQTLPGDTRRCTFYL